jgi:hypothetical protein
VVHETGISNHSMLQSKKGSTAMPSIYRKIYEKHHGPIPIDEEGRTYEIHHIDGNRKNNDIKNLIAVSIREHYQIHLDQGDYSSCIKIATRMKMSPETISNLAKQNNKKRVEEKTHNWLGEKGSRASKERQIKKVIDGTHQWLGKKNPVYILLENGTHPFMGKSGSEKTKILQRERVNNGTHHFLGGEIQKKSTRKRLKEGTHHILHKHICPHCGKEGKSPVMFRYHFDKCKKIL